MANFAPRILLVEDANDIAGPLERGLKEEGFYVQHVLTGRDAMRLFGVEQWDLIILDLTLPDMPGESILSNIKAAPDYPPVLILTARTELTTKLELFHQGCDDYLTKPFSFEELLGRVRALLRRSHRVIQKTNEFSGLTLDPALSVLVREGKSVQLTKKESALVQFLIETKGRLVSRKELLHHGWGLVHEPETNFIGVHLFNLRKKLSEVECEDWLVTIRGSGFVFKPPTELSQ